MVHYYEDGEINRLEYLKSCNMHILLRNNNTHIPESYKEKRTKNNYCTHKL
jgi:hypothetical protein